MKYMDKILESSKTIFTYQDINTIIGIENKDTIKSFFTRGIKSKIFQNITKGIYALNNFNDYELALKIKKNSYVSFETVLKKEGIIFQHYGDTIFLASDQSLEKNILNKNFKYLKIKYSILFNPLGLTNKGTYIIASPERAICDRIYLTKNYYFDNLENIDIKKLQEISQIYNKRVILEINKLTKNA